MGVVLSMELRKLGVLEAAEEVGRDPIIPAFENPGQLSPEPMPAAHDPRNAKLPSGAFWEMRS